MTTPPTLSQWNNSADWYDQNMGEDGDELNHEIIRPALLQSLGNIQDKTLLDIGCGSGYLTAELAKKAKEVVGTDFAPEFVSLCQNKYQNQSNLSFKVQDVTKQFEFEDEMFDMISCKMVLQYVENIATFATESYRVLRKNGKLIIVVDHPFNTQFYYAQSLAGVKNPKYEGLKDYFTNEPQTKLSLWGKVELTWYPKKVADYIKPFLESGLQLTDIQELAETKNGVAIPRILMLEFKKD